MATDVTVKVGADSTQLTSGLNNANKSVDQFSKRTESLNAGFTKVKGSIGALGSAGVATFNKLTGAIGAAVAALGTLAGVKSLFDEAGRINDLSNRFGENAESIQKIGIAAQQSGTDLETVAKALSKAGIAAVEAAKGNGEYDQAFAALGTTAEEFAGLPIEDKLAALSQGYVENANKAEANAAMVKLMGKSAMELIPLFAQGGEAIKGMFAEVDSVSTATIARMDEIGDRVGNIWQTLKNQAMTSIGDTIDQLDQLGIHSKAVFAYLKNPFGSDRLQNYRDTLKEGQQGLDDAKNKRIERNNTLKAANVEALRAEAQDEESGKVSAKYDKKMKVAEDKWDEKSATTGPSIMRAYSFQEPDLKEQVRKAKEKKEKVTDQVINREESVLESKKGKLDTLEILQSNKVDGDSLKRIGGGFAKSDYKGVAKQETLLQKQIDLQKQLVDKSQKQLDILKAANKTTETFDGVTS